MVALSIATLSGFTFPTVHIGFTAFETVGNIVPTAQVSYTGYGTVSSVVPATHMTVHVTKTIIVSASVEATDDLTTVETAHGARTSEIAQSSDSKETGRAAQSTHPVKTSAPTQSSDTKVTESVTQSTLGTRPSASLHSSSGVTNTPPSSYTASSFFTKTTSSSMESTPSETTAASISGPSIDEISSRIGIALAVAVILVAVVSYLCLVLWPKYRLRRVQETQTQPKQQKWWVWRKWNRDQPGASTRATEMDQISHMTPSSLAVFGQHNGSTVARPLNKRTATTASLWPVRLDHVWSTPEPVRFPFQGTAREVPSNSGSSTFSFDTLDGELEAAYVRQDQSRLYQPYVEDEVIEKPSQTQLRRPPTRRAVRVEQQNRPVSEVASLGTASDDEFEDVSL